MYRVTDEARLYFETLSRLAPERQSQWLDRLQRAIDRGEAERVLRPGQHNLFLDTIQITLLDSGRQVNAIPDRARALIDVRALPDTDTAELLRAIKSALGREVSVKVLLDSPAVEPSPTDSPTYRCLEHTLGTEAPVVPTLIAGVTDARYFRERGVATYGVSPFALAAVDAQGVHGNDERISERAFERGVSRMTDLLKACTTR